VKTLTGVTISVDADSVAALQKAIFDKEGIPIDQQILLSDRKVLASGAVLLPDATIQLVVSMEGGGKKKRKKKVFTKPKRIPHKKKKIKMAVLKYYQVDESNKITRLRRECTNKNCGAATFMAMHYDRYSCGRCGFTLVYQDKEEAKA